MTTDSLVPSALHSISWQMPFIIFLTVLSVALSLFLAVYAWQRRNKTGVLAFAWLMTATTESSIASALSMLSRTEDASRFWTNLIFLGLSAIPVLFLMFILQYSGRERWLSRRRIGMLFFIPLLTQVVVWTNDMHGLFFQQTQFARQGALMLVQTKRPGPWFGVHLGYTYLLFVLGSGCIVLMIIRPFGLYRKQAIGLLIAGIPPILNGLLINSGLIPAVKTQFTPVSYTLMGGVLAWTLFRHQFLDVVPVARDVLIDNMSDGMLVLDIQHRIVDLNPAAQHLLGPSPSGHIGQSACDALKFWHGLEDHLQQDEQVGTEIGMDLHGRHHYYHLRISPLTNKRGQQAGKLMMLRDISERKQAEMELSRHRKHLEELVSERTEKLQQEILERRRAEAQLTLSLQEKSILLKEIHHRVKNNMQVVSSLLNLQAPLLPDEKSRIMFHESRQRIKTMTLIHERLYQSEKLTDINFAEYVSHLVHDLYSSSAGSTSRIDFNLDIAELHLDLDTAIPCGLIVNELVSNAIKYAFLNGSGTITIRLRCGPEQLYELIIQDDGIGVPKSLEIDQLESLGLQLVKGLAEEQLEGTLNLDQNAPGTRWIIRFQEADQQKNVSK